MVTFTVDTEVFSEPTALTNARTGASIVHWTGESVTERLL